VTCACESISPPAVYGMSSRTSLARLERTNTDVKQSLAIPIEVEYARGVLGHERRKPPTSQRRLSQKGRLCLDQLQYHRRSREAKPLTAPGATSRPESSRSSTGISGYRRRTRARVGATSASAAGAAPSILSIRLGRSRACAPSVIESPAKRSAGASPNTGQRGRGRFKNDSEGSRQAVSRSAQDVAVGGNPIGGAAWEPVPFHSSSRLASRVRAVELRPTAGVKPKAAKEGGKRREERAMTRRESPLLSSSAFPSPCSLCGGSSRRAVLEELVRLRKENHEVRRWLFDLLAWIAQTDDLLLVARFLIKQRFGKRVLSDEEVLELLRL
jgi:hypothetical protein